MNKVLSTFLIIISAICSGYNQNIFGTYESIKKLHLWNPLCQKSKLIIYKDSTYTFIDCDWNSFDTIVGNCIIDGQTLVLRNFRNKEMRLFYKKNSFYFSKTRLFFKLKDYEKIE